MQPCDLAPSVVVIGYHPVIHPIPSKKYALSHNELLLFCSPEGRVIAEPIPDEALVVRGGRNLPADLVRGTGTHPSGVTGVSVECAVGVSVAELAAAIPHGQIGVTRVGAVRRMGGEVVRTTGRSHYYATVTGLIPTQISGLLTPTIPNPTREA